MADLYIPIEPVAASRIRFNRRTGGTYYEGLYRDYLTAMRGWLDAQTFDIIDDDFIHVDMDIVTTRNGDIDNFIKGIWDPCNGRLWQDDKQIVSVNAVLWHPDEYENEAGTYMSYGCIA